MKTPVAYIAFALGLGSALVHAQNPSPPSAGGIPAALQPPAGEKVILRAHATGWQVYTCTAGAGGKPQWMLKGPDADLHTHDGSVIGHHFAGPSWKYMDGSEVTGKVVAHADAPDPQSVPWLLLAATSHSGSGLFARVTSIQRIHTRGGQPPAVTQCDPSKAQGEMRSPYTADYYFYAR